MADAPAPPPAEPTDYNPGAGQAQQTGPDSGLFGVSSGNANAQVGSKHVAAGPRPTAGPNRGSDYDRVPAQSPEQFETDTLANMAQKVNGLAPDALKALQDRLFNAGFYGNTKLSDISFGTADEATQDAWNQLLNRNARGVAAGNKSSWEETLSEALRTRGINDPIGTDGKFESATATNIDAKTGAKLDIQAGSSSDSKSTSQTGRSHDLSQTSGLASSHTETTSTDTKFSDPTTAHALIVKAMQDKLGRDPTEGELGAFRGALHAYEAANPTVSKQSQDESRMTQASTDTTGSKSAAESSKTSGVQSQRTNSNDSSTTKGTQSQQTTSTTPGETSSASATDSPWSPELTQMMYRGATGAPINAATATSNQASTSGADSTASSTSNQASSSNSNTSTQNVDSSAQNANTTSNEGVVQSQNSTQSGGTNPADWAQFWVQEQNRPEMDEYHKATMYYNAALQVLGLGGR